MRKHPLNVSGKCLVDQDSCMWCAECAAIAPALFRLDASDPEFGAYVYKEPETPVEIEAFRRAAATCPLEAIVME